MLTTYGKVQRVNIGALHVAAIRLGEGYRAFIECWNLKPLVNEILTMALFTKETASLAGKKSKRGPNKISSKLIGYMGNDGVDKLMRIISELDGTEFVDAYVRIAPYIYPKLAAAQITTEGNLSINIIHPDSNLLSDV